MGKEVYKVSPIIIYPECILKTGMQNNCLNCDKKLKFLLKYSFIKPIY